MESYKVKDLTLAIFRQILLEDEFRGTPHVGIVIQAYLKDSEADLRTLLDWSRKRGTPVWVRLVKGAYWDYETVLARQLDWPVPVFERKWETDANYERLTRFLLLNHTFLRPALGSHNIRSLAHGLALARHLGLPESGLELQMLYGMGDPEKQVLVDMGYRMRIYMPYGELIPGMAYLVRRLLENTSNDSFLRASFAEHISPETLLMNPLDSGHASQSSAATPATKTPAEISPAATNSPFHNEPLTDFSKEESRRRCKRRWPAFVRPLVNFIPCGSAVGPSRRTSNSYRSIRRTKSGSSASWPPRGVPRPIGPWPRRAMRSRPGAPGRSKTAPLSCGARPKYMRRRRFELAAWEVYGCGKAWREADGDVCEAIDFCEFYAQQAVAMQSERGRDVPGEENRFLHLPRGVAVVIAPWNFPLAILTGMTTAALVTGNTVIMKPAEQSSVIAARLLDIFQELGLPAGVVNYLPGRGETVGAALVEHPDTAVIAFTGSRSVGLAINRPRRRNLGRARAPRVKRVIAEMGGKNAIIIDDDADLDEAVLGVVKSSFGYQGQKCSACSRVIVLERGV